MQLRFSIALHIKDLALLETIQLSLGVGKINYQHSLQSVQLIVESIKEIERIIEHLEKYKLITQKRSDYEQFKKIFNLMKNKEHLTKDGLEKIVALKSSTNLGLSENLLEAFSHVDLVARSIVKNQKIQDPF